MCTMGRKEKKPGYEHPSEQGFVAQQSILQTGLGTGLALAAKMGITLQVVHPSCVPGCSHSQSCWEHSSPTFLPQASGGAKLQIIPEPGGEMRCPYPPMMFCILETSFPHSKPLTLRSHSRTALFQRSVLKRTPEGLFPH